MTVKKAKFPTVRATKSKNGYDGSFMYLISDTPNNQNNDSSIIKDNSDMAILSNEDERLKLIGEILSNESSRNIFKLLISNELTAYEIVKKTNLSLSLVLHHINKMQTAGIAQITKISQTSRNQNMKYYTAKFGIIILPQTASEKAKTSKTFQNSLKKIMKFSIIGLAGIISWFSVQARTDIHMSPNDMSFESQLFWPLVISLSVLLVGLITERILSSLKSDCKNTLLK